LPDEVGDAQSRVDLVSLKRGLQDLAGLLDDFGLPFRHLAAEARSNLSHHCAIYRDHGVPP
jgi:hypothetical protein